MARILAACWPFHGHLFPMMSIALALRDLGHEVAFLTGPRAAETVTEQGFPVFVFETLKLDEHYRRLFADNAGEHAWYRMPLIASALQQSFLDTVPDQVEDVDRAVAQWQPDAIACDMLLWGPMLVTSARLPVAVCSVFPMCPLPGKGVPPFGLGWPPPRTWRRKLAAKALGVGAGLVRRRFLHRVNQLRARFQLPAIGPSFHEWTATLPLYFLPCSREFDYNRHDTPPAIHYVGPLLWNPTSRRGSNIEFVQSIPKARPWVHATEGTLHGGRPLILKAAAEGLSDLDVEVIMTTGEGRDAERLGLTGWGPNIHVAEWISHSALMPHLDLMITTGGAGSVLSAMNAGVPLILVPTAWDKPEVAQRVVEAGAGIRIEPRECNAHTVRAAVKRMLSDNSFRRNAQRVQQSFAGLGGPLEAARLIGGLVEVHSERGALT